MRRHPQKKSRWADHYTAKAKKERFPARSVYKLQEIQRRYRLIQRGDRILDLGCSPGSWLLYASGLVGKTGEVVGVDLKPVSGHLPSNTRVLKGDILHPGQELQEAIVGDFEGVMSDMAPSTSGVKHVDSARSFNLCLAALSVAMEVLKPGGFFICKIFQGEDFRNFTERVGIAFKKQSIFKPKSSRKASKEIFVIGLEKKE